jgi:hypothetical protein
MLDAAKDSMISADSCRRETAYGFSYILFSTQKYMLDHGDGVVYWVYMFKQMEH